MAFVTLVRKGNKEKLPSRDKSESSIDEPLNLFHMDLFGPVNIISISKKKYALVIVDDFTMIFMDILSTFKG